MNRKEKKLSNKAFAVELEKRTKKFAIDIIKTINKFNNTKAAQVIGYQIIKSATSIGANYREANRTVSKADFQNKIAICTKESSETQYWLELIGETEIIPQEKVNGLHEECSELLALFNSIYQACKVKKFN